MLVAEPIDWAATNGRAAFPNVEFAPGARAICRRFLHVPRDAHWAEVTLRGTQALGMPDYGVSHSIEDSIETQGLDWRIEYRAAIDIFIASSSLPPRNV